mmetsp:Transcript_7190/g.11343  ORF Transcript_7190/g.11343 Transcript_7190/m.11343 type:complete len:94 (-) Transcript_7190:223-504(-)
MAESSLQQSLNNKGVDGAIQGAPAQSQKELLKKGLINALALAFGMLIGFLFGFLGVLFVCMIILIVGGVYKAIEARHDRKKSTESPPPPESQA